MCTENQKTSDETLKFLGEVFSSVFEKNLSNNTNEENDYTSYSFFANNETDISFGKIKDDLSYSDPLRIVCFKELKIAVVHHSIYDKYKRSECNLSLHNAIRITALKVIKNKEISKIVKQIRKIKKAKWKKGEKIKSKVGLYEVKVTKINV